MKRRLYRVSPGEVRAQPREQDTGPDSYKRLLVVDDEPIIREVLRRSLESQRYTVDVAQDGEDAWVKTYGTTYDCILLDLNMPGSSGEEFYRLVEQWDEGLAKKVIFITGNTVTPDTHAFIFAAGNPVMRKPFHLEELHREILKSLERSVEPAG